MIDIGKYNKMRIARIEDQGHAWLTQDYDEHIKLHKAEVPEGLDIGDEVEVFVFKDSDNQKVATTKKPLVTLHDYAMLKVESVTGFGAFVNWGMPKDLLVPFEEQRESMEEGKFYLVYLYNDLMSGRLVGTTKISRYAERDEITVADGDEVDLTIWYQTDLGRKVIINRKHIGLIYENQIFETIREGDEVKGYIKEVRPDKNIDVTLQKQGYANVEPNAQKILDMLQTNEGFLGVNDKSDPQRIQGMLSMSKKTFKKAVGALYKQRVITIDADGIRLISQESE